MRAVLWEPVGPDHWVTLARDPYGRPYGTIRYAAPSTYCVFDRHGRLCSTWQSLTAARSNSPSTNGARGARANARERQPG